VILPDANLLVAFTWENHQHNTAARTSSKEFATLEEALARRFPEVSEWIK